MDDVGKGLKNFLWGVAATVAGGIILFVLQAQLGKEADLTAVIRPVPFVFPQDLAESHARDSAVAALSTTKEVLEIEESDWAKFEKNWAKFFELEMAVGDEASSLGGLVLIAITNKGEVPAKEVILHVRDVAFYSVGQQGGGKIIKAENEDIELSTIAQGQTHSLVAWTTSDIRYDDWKVLDSFRLSHADGVGDVTVRIPVSSFYAYLDRNTLFIFWAIWIPLAIWAVISGVSNLTGSHKEPEEKQAKDEPKDTD